MAHILEIEDLVVRRLGRAIREEFKIDCVIRSLGDSELYGSKIVAFFARNTLKDSFDVYRLLEEGADITRYKKGTLFNFLGSTKSMTRILNFDPREVPKDYNEQYQNLGNSDYSLEQHIATRIKVKNLVFNMLTEQDCYYILASALGILDQTDYEFNDRPSIVTRTKLNKYEMNFKAYRTKVTNLFEDLPIKSDRVRELYIKYII